MSTRTALRGTVVVLSLLGLLGLACGSASAAPQPTDPVIHVVRWGETLYLIARQYGTTTQAIAGANNLRNINFVYAGQRLVIPSSSSPSSASSTGLYVVQRGDTLRTIAARHGTTVAYLASLNGLRDPNFIWVGQRLQVPSSGTTSAAPAQGSTVVHVVQRGEFLASIAWKYGTTASAIATANRLVNPSLIYVGQRLTIPAAGTTPADSGVPSNTSGVPASSGEKWIDVNLSTQTLRAYEGNQVVYTALVSTGISRYPTPAGTFHIQRKYWYDDMTGGSQARGDYYYLPNVPYCMYYYAGYSLHGTYWHSNFGTPMSHGCTNLSIPDAAWLFNWAPLGTRVVNHY
jgi:LysM repeat protein